VCLGTTYMDLACVMKSYSLAQTHGNEETSDEL